MHRKDQLFEAEEHDADGVSEPQQMVVHEAAACVRVDFLAFLEDSEVEAQAQPDDGAAGDDNDAADASHDGATEQHGGHWCSVEEHVLVLGHALVEEHVQAQSSADDGAPVVQHVDGDGDEALHDPDGDEEEDGVGGDDAAAPREVEAGEALVPAHTHDCD